MRRLSILVLETLKGINVKTEYYFSTDDTDYLVIIHRAGWIYHDSAEHLIMYVAINMFYQLSVGESDIGFQCHKSNLCGRAETAPAPQPLLRQTCCFCYTVKQKHGVKPAKLTLIKTIMIFFQNIKFCKTQSGVDF